MNDVVLVRDPLFLQHDLEPGHPENPGRLTAIHGLFEKRSDWKNIPTIKPKELSESHCLLIHAREMYRELLEKRGHEGWIDPDTYYGAKSIEVALKAAGATTQAAIDIWSGKYRRGFSFVRPPGHHATPKKAMGFCLLNNVAIAAAAIRDLSPHARIAIVDFDLHHGNGTQDAFYHVEEVLFVSSHRYPFYPGSGAANEIGEGRGKGTTINYPLGSPYGTKFFIELYTGKIREQIKAYKPNFILVSAGFDGHVLDPMRGFAIETEGYGVISQSLIELAEEENGKILFCLEGGYNPQALADSVEVVMEKLINVPTKSQPQEG